MSAAIVRDPATGVDVLTSFVLTFDVSLYGVDDGSWPMGTRPASPWVQVTPSDVPSDRYDTPNANPRGEMPHR